MAKKVKTKSLFPSTPKDHIRQLIEWMSHGVYEKEHIIAVALLCAVAGENMFLHRIDTQKKDTFKFISDTLPNPRAVFLINGKRFLCEKLTATFTESGLSHLLKGTFWPIAD